MVTIAQSGDLLRLLVTILLTVVRSSHQAVYSCNASVSCGCSRNSAVLTRIVGGETASAATWSWAVSISIADSYLCGGSIISSSWVITAAHCVNGYKASKITVYAGSNLPWSGTQSRVASRVIVNSGYNSVTYINDIALLELASPLIMTDPYVSSICLPSVSSTILSSSEWPPAGTTVVAVGWGRLSENGSLASSLQQVTLQTVNYKASTCISEITDWHLQLCAGVSGGGKDTCQGDSGGPLMMFSSNNQWVLVGVTSNGIGCAEAAYSGIYTRVAAYQSWINTNTNGAAATVTISASTTLSTSTTGFASTTTPASTTVSTSRALPASTTVLFSTTERVSTTISASTTVSSWSSQFASTTVSASTNKSTSTSRSTSTSVSNSTVRYTSSSQSASTTGSGSTTISTSTAASYFTSSILAIQLHGTIVEISICNVLVFVLLNFLVASYF